MIRVQILDFNKESELVFTATFEMVRAINSTYDCGNYTLEVNRKVVFNGFVSNDQVAIVTGKQKEQWKQWKRNTRKK